MRNLILTIVLSFIAVTSFLLAPATYAHHGDYYHYNSPFDPSHPDYSDGNLRLTLKNRADIERASRPNDHYDKYTKTYYGCNWKFNEPLDTWVCEKSQASVGAAQPVSVCPYGTTRHPIQQTCVTTQVPVNAYLAGNGWACNAGYHMNYARTGCIRNVNTVVAQTEPIEYVIIEKTVHIYETPDRLPSTGPMNLWTLVVGSLGGLILFALKDSLN